MGGVRKRMLFFPPYASTIINVRFCQVDRHNKKKRRPETHAMHRTAAVWQWITGWIQYLVSSCRYFHSFPYDMIYNVVSPKISNSEITNASCNPRDLFDTKTSHNAGSVQQAAVCAVRGGTPARWVGFCTRHENRSRSTRITIYSPTDD